MSTNPEQIRQDIERTRGRLSDDVNELTETVRPGNVARRQADKVTGRAAAHKDRVMGSADDLTQQGSGTAHQLGDRASEMSDRAAQMPQKARQQARGNPLGAGLVALGAGWLLGSLLPASQRERQATEQLKEKAQPVVDEVKSVTQETVQDLKEPAKQAVEEVKQSAAASAETVKQEGASTASDVKSSADDSAQTVRSSGQQG
jgi:ElaB/YqjD/DUF883 family membrane-anchored ribosome-binding protein